MQQLAKHTSFRSMATATVVGLLLALPSLLAASPSPYLSPTTLVRNYRNMLSNFRIFVYPHSKPLNFGLPSAASLFYDSLLRSRFVSDDPDQADLFFVPFSPDASARALGRLVRDLRNTFPYWNRTLGADHFFLSPAGIDFSSDRNVLELKKNSVQISLFPVVSGLFIPHKDITLPPLNPSSSSLPQPLALENSTYLGHLRWEGTGDLNLVNQLKGDSDFFVEELKSGRGEMVKPSSRFCLFFYGGEVAWAWLAEAMAEGCVPVVIVERPIQDLPFMDVVRWSDMALVVGGTEAWRLKEMVNEVTEEKQREMREMGMAGSKHLVWKQEAQPEAMDAFHTVMYQLWQRRHVVRYARREFL